MNDFNKLKGQDAIALTQWLKGYLELDDCRYIVHLPKSDNAGAFEFSGNRGDIDRIHAKYTKVNPDFEVGFQSKVLKDGKIYHIPMIDFTRLGVNNIFDVKDFLTTIEEKGFIVDSGGCFHFYGVHLLSESEWYIFMEKCSAFRQVGRRYPSHQLRRGEATLRQTSSGLKPSIPTVVGYLS